MFTIACCLEVRLGLGLLLVSGWLVVMYTHLLSLYMYCTPSKMHFKLFMYNARARLCMYVCVSNTLYN